MKTRPLFERVIMTRNEDDDTATGPGLDVKREDRRHFVK